MWQKQTKNKAVGCGSRRLQSDKFVLVETHCTVPFLSRKCLKEFLLTKSMSHNL